MNSKDYRSILLNIYEHYHLEKMKDVKELLSKYKGQEEQLLQAVYEKYNISPKDRAVYETPNNIVTKINSEKVSAEELPTSTKSNRTIWLMAFIAILLIAGISIWYANSQGSSNNNAPEEVTQASNVSTAIDTTKKYPSLVLEDLRQLRIHPDQTLRIEEKGYRLLSTKGNDKTFVGTLGDTVIINKKWLNDITKVSWWSGVNRRWLYNHMRDEMRRKYTYSEMLSNTDESDNEIEGLPYFRDECYFDNNSIRYKAYVIYHKSKIIGYGVEINECY